MKSNEFVTYYSPKDSHIKFLKVTQTYCQVMYKLHIAGSSYTHLILEARLSFYKHQSSSTITKHS